MTTQLTNPQNEGQWQTYLTDAQSQASLSMREYCIKIHEFKSSCEVKGVGTNFSEKVQEWLGISASYGRKLALIGSSEIVRSANVDQIPSSIETQYLLVSMGEEKLKTAIDSGAVTGKTTRADVQEMKSPTPKPKQPAKTPTQKPQEPAATVAPVAPADGVECDPKTGKPVADEVVLRRNGESLPASEYSPEMKAYDAVEREFEEMILPESFAEILSDVALLVWDMEQLTDEYGIKFGKEFNALRDFNLIYGDGKDKTDNPFLKVYEAAEAKMDKAHKAL